ncbi:hypothetical protein M1M30_gp015 [Maribacter phage Colly_1]|uniref:Uncharacterized protein n=1 Tax=Maribacter phage Colly_1 TaxID=2745691 RepID=A0A8E4UXW7_9CAUD|nr:hypothetical protein M1M30_gp015 [Maribacter phage Colly_1]QQO97251.1 hypothetical protein Colly1_15 [Maribacter phage Colly_1]
MNQIKKNIIKKYLPDFVYSTTKSVEVTPDQLRDMMEDYHGKMHNAALTLKMTEKTPILHFENWETGSELGYTNIRCKKEIGFTFSEIKASMKLFYPNDDIVYFTSDIGGLNLIITHEPEGYTIYKVLTKTHDTAGY